MILKIGYVSLMLVFVIIICNDLKKIWNREEQPTKEVRYLMTVATAMIIGNMILSWVNNRTFATFLYGIFHAGNTWLVFGLVCFTEAYTKLFKKVDIVYNSIRILCLVDTISLLSNCVFGHAFSLARMGNSIIGYWYVASFQTPMFYFHLILCYTMSVLVIIPMLNRVVVLSSVYRKKYIYILALFLVLMFINSVCLNVKMSIDWILMFYAVMCIVILKYAIYFVPQEVVERSLSLIVKNTSSAIVVYDIEGKPIYYNRIVEEFCNKQNLDFKFLDTFLEEFKLECQQDGTKRFEWEKEVVVGNKTLFFAAEYNPVYDGRQKFVGSYFSFDDRTEEHNRLKEEIYRANFDPLTNIYNKNRFFEAVQEEIKANPERERIMIVSDIRDFRLINDLFGTDKGDEILKMQASEMRRLASEGSIFGRLESDRFALCMYKSNFKESVIKDIIKKMGKDFEGGLYHLHVHCGVYEIHDPNESVVSMCDKAYIAIKDIETEYDTYFSYFNEEHLKKTLQDKRVISEFTTGIQNKEFEVYLQPQVNPQGKLLAAEALVRWNNSSMGMISPGVFIPALERGGLIYKLDIYVWEMAIAQLAKWKEKGFPIVPVSLNISPKDFINVEIDKVLAELLEKYNLEAKYVNLEITESVLLNRTETNISMMKRLKGLGFKMELDDFGSGFSSLNMLKNLEVDVLKIDRGFLLEIKNQTRAKAILRAIIELSQELNMIVITEGVETKEQVDMLTEMGCNCFQGFYFSKPVSLEEFEKNFMNVGD